MQPTSLFKITLPDLALAPGGRVNSIAKARKVPMRVYILNLSGSECFFGFASESMIGPDAPGNDVFELPVGRDVTFVLAPEQVLYGCANGAGAAISVATSDAYPDV